VTRRWGKPDGEMGRSGDQDIRGIGDWELSLNADCGMRLPSADRECGIRRDGSRGRVTRKWGQHGNPRQPSIKQCHSARIYAKIQRNVERDGGKAMDFYTMVLRKSGKDWVALCLENGLVGQGMTKEESIRKLKEAIECFEDIRKTEEDVYSAPISIKELHEFLTIEGKELVSQSFELRAVNA